MKPEYIIKFKASMLNGTDVETFMRLWRELGVEIQEVRE